MSNDQPTYYPGLAQWTVRVTSKPGRPVRSVQYGDACGADGFYDTKEICLDHPEERAVINVGRAPRGGPFLFWEALEWLVNEHKAGRIT